MNISRVTIDKIYCFDPMLACIYVTFLLVIHYDRGKCTFDQDSILFHTYFHFPTCKQVKKFTEDEQYAMPLRRIEYGYSGKIVIKSMMTFNKHRHLKFAVEHVQNH